MRVEYDDRREVYMTDDPRAPRFRTIEAGFGWLDDKGDAEARYHWCVAAGLTENREIHFLEEHYGPMHRLVEVVIDMRDRLLIERMYADYTQDALCRYLHSEECDGLTRYFDRGKDVFDRPIYTHKHNHWPSFRTRDMATCIVPLNDEDVPQFLAGYDVLVAGIAKKTTQFRRDCRLLPNLVKGRLKETLDHPGLKAAVWVHTGLVRRILRDRLHQDTEAAPVYGNMPR